MALRRVYWHVTQHGRREIVDADLRDYFTSIPHSPLMRSLARRISDGRMLRIIKSWMTAPVVEVIGGQPVQTTEAKRTRRGTPQGGVIASAGQHLPALRPRSLGPSMRRRNARGRVSIVRYANDFAMGFERRRRTADVGGPQGPLTEFWLSLHEAGRA